MTIGDSSNGYCKLWVIGDLGVGKTAIINGVFGRNFDGNSSTHDYRNDGFISTGYYNAKVQITEVRSPDQEIFRNSIVHDFYQPSVFLVVASLSSVNTAYYETEVIEIINIYFPTSPIFLIYNSSEELATPQKGNKRIRDIFSFKNFDSANFQSFRNILENTIINIATDRLAIVKEKILQNYNKREKILDVGNCDLTSLYEIPELFYNDHLETLIISNEWAEFVKGKWTRKESENSGGYNNLGSLPDQIQKLKNLQTLIIGGDWNLDKKVWRRWRIKNITSLTHLANLKTLNVSNNLVAAIPNFSKLKGLRTLHLNNNRINRIIFKGDFLSLEELYLSNNLITSINFFDKISFPAIKTIDLHGNKIKDLEPLKSILNKLEIKASKWEQQTINVAKNPLEKPPIEIVNIGKDAVLNYFDELLLGKNYINKDVKLILVGNSEVGKTTLAKYLDNEKDLNVIHRSTHWLEEREISSKKILSKINQKCIINLFDFGGHDFFHDTHHLFFTSNAIYILLWDKSTNRFDFRTAIQENSRGLTEEVQFQDYPLRYWLDSIKYFIKDNSKEIFDFPIDKQQEYNTDILIIQNKVELAEHICFLNEEQLKNDYGFIYDFLNMSIIGVKRNMNYFDDILIEILNNTSIIGARLPGFYGNVKAALKQYDGSPILSLNEFTVFCNNIPGVKISLVQANFLAGYLAEVGLIMYYPLTGNNLIYIDKKWVIDKIYKILERLSAKDGEFEIGYLDEIFEKRLQKRDKESIVKLMVDFKLIFLHPLSEHYIAPLYLPLKPHDLVDLFIDEGIISYRRFVYRGFIHKNVILTLFQRYGKFVLKDDSRKDYYYYWRDGLIIKDIATGEIVKIQFYLGNNNGNAHIDIFKLNVFMKTLFVDEIVKFINEINDDYEAEETGTIDGIDYISIKLLNNNAENGKLVFTETSLYKEKNQDYIEKKIFELKNYTMFLKDGIRKKKVVISYSKKDLGRVHTFIRYMQPLVDLGLIDRPWYCSLLNPADDWDEKIQHHFDEADIIFFMVSEYFYSTNYIVEKEIKTTIDRYDKDKSVKIVPIVLEHYDWERKDPHNLQRFSALPFQAKPISDFKNEKLAWSTVTASVRHMIEKDLDPGKIDIISRDLQEIYERQVKGHLDNNNN